MPDVIAVTVLPPTVIAVSIADARPTTVIVEQPTTVAVTTGAQCPPGAYGETGGASFQAPAGETLSGHRVVQLIDGKAFYCDAATPEHAGTAIGLTTGAVLVGDDATIQSLGNLTELSWAWLPGPVYVGNLGQLTQTPSGAFNQQIGIAISATAININSKIAIRTE